MNKKETIFLAAALAVILIFGSAAYRALAPRAVPEPPPAAADAEPVPADDPASEPQPSAPADTAPERDAAPDFTVYDAEGNALRLSDLRGAPVLINFWASWCPPCRSELPEFDEAFAAYGDRVRFLMVDLTGGGETQEGAARFIAENGYAFPVYFDLAASAADANGIYSIPVTMTVDAEGNVVDSRIGALTGEQLTAMLDALVQ